MLTRMASYPVKYYDSRYPARSRGNPKISLWLSVDPVAEKYPGMSPYNYTAGNPVKYIDPDGRSPVNIIIHGKNGNTLTIKAPGDDIHFYFPVNIKQSTTIDLGIQKLEDIAIGYQFTVQNSFAPLIGSQNALLSHNVMFFNSEYGGYWYTYGGGESALRFEGGVTFDYTLAGSFFIAVNKSGRYNPKFFEGKYQTVGINPSLKVLGEIGINIQYSYSNNWDIYEFGIDIGMGLSSSYGGAYWGGGKTKLLTPVIKTSARSYGDILQNQLNYNPIFWRLPFPIKTIANFYLNYYTRNNNSNE